MRIVQLVPAMEQGGVERGVVEMNRALVVRGHDNVIVSAGGRLTARLAADGGRCVTLDVKSKNPLTYFSRARALRRLLTRERPDVVVAHSRVPAWLFVWANRTLRLPWITFAHGANSVSRYSRVMTAGDVTVTPSRYIADYLKAAYGLAEEKLCVIPRAIDRDRFDPARLDRAFLEAKRAEWGLAGRRVAMGVGRITQLKGYDTLIRATAIARRTIPELKTVIVGEAEALRKDVEASLRALVDELGLADAVVFAGNQQKIAECLSLADVVVSANTRKPEAFGRSMAEALAMNRPVVATAFGGALDIVEDGVNGVRVPVSAADAQGFAAALVQALEKTWGDVRTPALEKFSFERMIDRSLAVYARFDPARPAPGVRSLPRRDR
jgi:glycosyltransferase involved in cell wall biosynthesis